MAQVATSCGEGAIVATTPEKSELQEKEMRG